MDRDSGTHSRCWRHRGEAPGLGVRTQTAHGGRPGCGSCRDHRHPAQPQHTAPRPSSLSPPLPGNAWGPRANRKKNTLSLGASPNRPCVWPRDTPPTQGTS